MGLSDARPMDLTVPLSPVAWSPYKRFNLETVWTDHRENSGKLPPKLRNARASCLPLNAPHANTRLSSWTRISSALLPPHRTG